MKANELRVGNWVQKDLSIDDFINVRLKSGDLMMYDIECQEEDRGFCTILPIPLTEEILLKCGFEYNKNDCRWYNFSFVLEYWNSQKFFIYGYVGGNITIKYLHQLQNLYFALTNEELNIEL